MKQLALFIFMFAVATQVHAGTHRFTTCDRKETDAVCINRAVKTHPAVKMLFHTGKRSERPAYLNAIYSDSPEIESIIEFDAGDKFNQTFFVVYPVEAKRDSKVKHVAFNVRMVKQIERINGQREVVGRRIADSQIEMYGVSED